MAADKDPFLRQIAVYYDKAYHDRLTDFTFVFPNRRSTLFFQKYLREAQGMRLHDFSTPFLAPPTVTFDDLIARWTTTVEASRTELLIHLYAAYLEVTKSMSMAPEDAMDLSAFSFWGEVILDDFNEIDLSMADASDVLRNLRDLKSIETNPLDSEKWELVKQFWDTTGLEHLMPDDSGNLFIDHTLPDAADKKNGPAAKAFVRIWQILSPLYHGFRQRLERHSLHYAGMVARQLAERLSSDITALQHLWKPGERFVFAGFADTLPARLSIMQALRDTGVADFFWDLDLPVFNLADNVAARSVRKLAEKYPAPIELQPPTGAPIISIVGVPSEIAQVKEASSTLAAMNIKSHEASSVAVVLADEALCVPLLNSLDLPEGVDVNITMGYPLRLSPVASALETFALMQSRSRYVLRENITTFFRDDVSRLLSHPLLMRLAPQECRELIARVDALRLYNLPADELQDKAGRLAPLFVPVKGVETGLGAFSGIRSAVSCLLSLFPETSQAIDPAAEGEEPDEPTDDLWVLDRGFLSGYLDELDTLQQCLDDVLGPDVRYGGTSVMRSVARMMSSRKVSFSGAPLRGLQVLGIGETRTLDFDHIVALSMNERVFPRRTQSPTFIPQTLRKAYGLPLAERKEAETAYAFFRMLARAKEVTLIYNANTEGITSGEMSRYLYQLIYAYRPENLTATVKNYRIGAITQNAITLTKSDAAMREIAAFFPSTGRERAFSASTIKGLLDCEMRFFLENVAGFRLPDEVKTYIDDSIYGKIVHEALESLYNHQADAQKRSDGGALITSALLHALSGSPLLERYVIRAVNHIYLGREGAAIARVIDDLDTPLDGEPKLFAALIKKNVKRLLEAEAAWVSEKYEVVYLHGESRNTQVLKLADDLSINFTHIIDRIDKVTDEAGGTPYLRLVDYKTGREMLSVSNVDRLIDYTLTEKNHPHGMTQLMIYCNSYSQQISYNGRIQPFIYPLRDIIKGDGIKELKVGYIDGNLKRLNPLTDYRDINDEFLRLLSERIRHLLDPDAPVMQTPLVDDCKYCTFKEICNR